MIRALGCMLLALLLLPLAACEQTREVLSRLDPASGEAVTRPAESSEAAPAPAPIYQTTRNESGACIAARQLSFDDDQGRAHTGSFSFGLAPFGERTATVLSLYAPTLGVAEGSERLGSVILDDREHTAVYFADAENVYTAYADRGLLDDVRQRFRATLILPDGARVEVPLTGTFQAGAEVERCAREMV